MPFPKSKHAILAYTAGIVDGEGSIMILKTSSPSTTRGYTYQLKVAVTNTNEWLVQWMKFQHGGGISMQIPKNPKDKNVFHWRVTAKQAYRFLKDIEPYLILKRNQAELALKFQEHRKKGKTLLTDEENAVYEAQRITMKEYNRKGVG